MSAFRPPPPGWRSALADVSSMQKRCSQRITTRVTAGLSFLLSNHMAPRERASKDSLQDDAFEWLLYNPVLCNRYLIDRRAIGGRSSTTSLFIGVGGYSRLVAAYDMFDNTEPVAIKIMAPGSDFTQVGLQEYNLLTALNQADPLDTCHVVRCKGAFRTGGHSCLVLERLRQSLQGQRLCLSEIRAVAWQLLVFLQFLQRENVVHADLKPANILIADRGGREAGLSLALGYQQVKVIDFGNAFRLENAEVYYTDFELQSLAYRAPEVVCGLDLTPAIDVWSLGCILAELFLGSTLMTPPAVPLSIATLRPAPSATAARMSPLALLYRMWEVVGHLPTRKLSEGRLFSKYFTPDHRLLSFWLEGSTIVDPGIAIAETQPSLSQREAKLAAALNIPLGPDRSNDQHLFVSFLLGLLDPNPATRLTPAQAVSHAFLMPLFPVALFVRRSGEFATPVRQQQKAAVEPSSFSQPPPQQQTSSSSLAVIGPVKLEPAGPVVSSHRSEPPELPRAAAPARSRMVDEPARAQATVTVPQTAAAKAMPVAGAKRQLAGQLSPRKTLLTTAGDNDEEEDIVNLL